MKHRQLEKQLNQVKKQWQADMRAYTDGKFSREQYDLSRTLFMNDYDRLMITLANARSTET